MDWRLLVGLQLESLGVHHRCFVGPAQQRLPAVTSRNEDDEGAGWGGRLDGYSTVVPQFEIPGKPRKP